MVHATPGRRRVLFCVESVTLSQVVRLVVLARSLDPARYEVHFASGDCPEACFVGSRFERHDLPTVPAASVLRRVAWGRRPYERRTLRRYVAEELALFDRVRPDAVVGDFRLSLAVSAPVAGLPLFTLVNAYWSPYAVRDRWPVPDHPVLGLLRESVAERHFATVLPWMLQYFAAPLNDLRREHGLPPVGGLLEMLTGVDRTLYADVPALAPVSRVPSGHWYLGPLLWSPAVEIPAAFEVTRPGPPWVYVTLGSSGDVRVLPRVLAALADLPVRVMVATAGRGSRPNADHPQVHTAPLLPGEKAARLSAFVVCNGGSSTGYQALACGTPVLGLPSNLDQHLAMTAIERSGAGIAVRARGATVDAIRAAARRLLSDGRHREAAERVAMEFRAYDAVARFAQLLDGTWSIPAAATSSATVGVR
jgi:UDP:flavonoid glycosyltransferase YjiC (YdhE family)